MIGVYHYIAAGLFATFALLDLVARARVFPKVALWRLKGAAFVALYFSVATVMPLFWDGVLGQHRLVDATTLPVWAQTVLGLLAIELGIYVWHRTMHNVQFLWRWFHQMHHSAERVDIWGAFYFSPLDMLGWSFLGSLCLVFFFGIGAEAAIFVNVIVTFLSMFQHANLSTSHWVGWFIARPEMHSVHHERGVHAYNYCDLPIIDMIFGTYRNPPNWSGQAGFYEGGSKRLLPMLLGREIA